MSVGISGSNPAYSLQSVLSAQIALLTETAQLTSGSRITNAAIDPSGLAIYNNLETQSQGADTANENITEASDAVNVAQGATSTIQTSLSQINNLAIEANNGFNSPSDDAALQAQATALEQGINQIASNTNFNGTQLINGANSGNTPPTAATATITNDDVTGAGGGVVTSTSASAATTSGTFNVSVDATGNADVTYTDNATQTTVAVGSFAANSSTTFNGTTINFGNFSANDAGTTATIQTTAASAGSVQPTVTVQSGASEGQTTTVTLPNASTTGLGISNIDLSNPASATNAEGQINGAITTLNAGQAELGAETNSLQNQFENNNVYSNNLAGSASSIGDDNVGQTVTAANQNTLLEQISYAVLARANADAGHLSSFLSQYA
ncbi:MAG: flagellin [Candidatus Lustribacter sp.]|jgi:flagellin